ncbi:fatty acid desaturase [Oxalobacteraceae bacterium GrIS 1.11]
MSVQQGWVAFAALVGADLVLRLLVHVYYADGERVLRILRLRPRRLEQREHYYQPLDAWLAPLPCIWTWFDIVAAALLAALLDNALGWLALVIWSGGRFRALQEFGHNAVHFALCRSHDWQWCLADFFYQFPAFKRDMHNRHIAHTLEHHRHPNHESKDPNRTRVYNGGMAYPLNSPQFYWRTLYPLSWAGLRTNLVTMARNSMLNHHYLTVLVRIVSLAAVGAVLYWAAGWRGVVCGWCLPLLSTYPLFAWWSLLTEHRWFVSGDSTSRRELECLMGRPTDYVGVRGWLVRVFICPTSDAYHLVHSLYPAVRWNYLPALDRHFKIEDPLYTAHASQGLLFSRDGIPSALSELRQRLTAVPPSQADLQSQGR